MPQQFLFFLVTLFFVTMNVLLWRSEFGGRSALGSSVPAEVVWQKVLTAPDNSFLEIRHHGRKIGTCHWSPSVGQALTTGKTMTDDLPPEGMVNELTGYSIDLNGNVALNELNRVRFSFDLRLSTNQAWQEMSLRLSLRPNVWEVHSVAAKQTIQLKTEDGAERSERFYKFSDLQNPEKILRDLGGPLLPFTLASFGIPLNKSAAGAPVSLGLDWHARNDWLQLGHSRMRVFRLEARLLDRFKAVIFVSLVGEILRLELPDEIVLMSDALSAL